MDKPNIIYAGFNKKGHLEVTSTDSFRGCSNEYVNLENAVEWLKNHSQFCIGLDYYGEPYVDTPVLVREFKRDMRRKSKIQKLFKEAKEKLLAKQKKGED